MINYCNKGEEGMSSKAGFRISDFRVVRCEKENGGHRGRLSFGD